MMRSGSLRHRVGFPCVDQALALGTMTDEARPPSIQRPVRPEPAPIRPGAGRPSAGRAGAGRTARRVGRVWQGLSIAGIVAVALAGLTAISWLTHSSGQVAVDKVITKVEIDVSSGLVEIIGSDADRAALEFEATSGWNRDGGITHEVTGDTLVVDGGCDTGPFLGLWCRSDLKVIVPAGVEVAATSAGSITATGLSGPTELNAHSGDVSVNDQTGRLTAHSAGGSVVVDGLDTDTAKVTSSAGPVTVHAVRPPRSLDAESSAGDVTVRVPGGVSYDLETDSSIGDETVNVQTLPGAGHQIRAFSSAGSVEVSPN